MGLKDFLFGNRKKNKANIEDNYHEFCPRCEANITLQKGYSNDLPYWVCKGCGEMLINPSISDDIAWICDGCEAMLNIQEGFIDNNGTWKCTECGYVNTINENEMYLSDEAYREDLKNPYRGMSDSDVLELMQYITVGEVKNKPHIQFVEAQTGGKVYVKKTLETYDISVFKYLKEKNIPYMPTIYGLYEGDKYLVVIEEYIEGDTLECMLERSPLSLYDAVNIAIKMVKTLRILHKLDRPIIHRDIKPSNIIIVDDDVYILDVNVAKWYKPDDEKTTRLLGTLHYAAPEQFGYGLNALSPKVDIYAMGVVLNVMLTGKIPKEEKATGVVWDIISKCISLNPEDRYDDDELIQALEKLVED